MTLKSSLKAYQQTNLQDEVMNASPHRLIQMLMEAAIEKIIKARFYFEHEDAISFGEHISWALSIVGGLQVSLNKDQGGELAERLEELYSYIQLILVKANAENNPAYLDEAIELIKTVKSGWDEIPDEFHHVSSLNQTEQKANAEKE